MSGASLHVDVTTNTVSDVLRRLAAATSDLRPAMEDIGAEVVDLSLECFKQQRDPYGQAWQPLSVASLFKGAPSATKRGGFRAGFVRRLQGRQILIDTARLRNSLTYQADSSSVVAGTNVEYAAAHNFGAGKTVQVKAHTRTVGQVFGRMLKTPVRATVSAHSRRMSLPARAFLPAGDLPPVWEQSVLDVLALHFEGAYA